MASNPSWETASGSPIKTFSAILRGSKVHYRAHNIQKNIPMLRQVNSFHTTLCHSMKIHFNIILVPTSTFTWRPLSFCFSHTNFIHSPLFPQTCYLPCPSHPPWLHHYNYTSQRVEAMELLIVHVCPASSYFIPLRSEQFPQHPVPS
jgi:hypothetical protein